MIKIDKFFNTAGPVNFDECYKLDPLHRWELDEILTLIHQRKYFLLHAPRQSGKTSCMLALQEYLNEKDDYIAIYFNVESAQVARHDVNEGIKTILSELGSEAADTMEDDHIRDELFEYFNKYGAKNALTSGLEHISRKSSKPVMIFIDEIDSLIGDTLVSVLRQLRTGYKKRPGSFPQSVILCGLVDIKDYKIHKSDGEIITGGSCFNIKSESLTLGNFSKEEIKQLYLEHTKETGQVFEDGIFELAWEYTGGQPWLVNALAYEVCFKMKENRDRKKTITVETFKEAKERLILSRATHLDQLADKLKEERVRNVIQPMLIGKSSNASEEDEQYCLDLGLISLRNKELVISNDIYKEVLPRELTYSMQRRFVSMFKPEWINENGSIDCERLLQMFQQFWQENSEAWSKELTGYTEAAPHLIFQAFLQRVGNGQGFIDREYALSKGRADLYLRWKSTAGEQRIVFELKIHSEHTSLPNVIKTGLTQTAEYVDICNATESYLIIFDRRENIDWKDKIFTELHEQDKYTIKVWGM